MKIALIITLTALVVLVSAFTANAYCIYNYANIDVTVTINSAFNNKVIIKGPPGPVPGLDVNPACCPSTDPACNPSGSVTNVLSPMHFKSSCGCYDSASIVADETCSIIGNNLNCSYNQATSMSVTCTLPNSNINATFPLVGC